MPGRRALCGRHAADDQLCSLRRQCTLTAAAAAGGWQAGTPSDAEAARIRYMLSGTCALCIKSLSSCTLTWHQLLPRASSTVCTSASASTACRPSAPDAKPTEPRARSRAYVAAGVPGGEGRRTPPWPSSVGPAGSPPCREPDGFGGSWWNHPPVLPACAAPSFFSQSQMVCEGKTVR